MLNTSLLDIIEHTHADPSRRINRRDSRCMDRPCLVSVASARPISTNRDLYLSEQKKGGVGEGG